VPQLVDCNLEGLPTIFKPFKSSAKSPLKYLHRVLPRTVRMQRCLLGTLNITTTRAYPRYVTHNTTWLNTSRTG
jgi:hypothetical protein